jgi:hypothetical protein
MSGTSHWYDMRGPLGDATLHTAQPRSSMTRPLHALSGRCSVLCPSLRRRCSWRNSGGRDRKTRAGVKVEGRKSVAELRPETVELARSLARARPAHSGNPAFRRPSINSFEFEYPPRAINAEIAKAGSVSSTRAAASRASASRPRWANADARQR